MTQHEPPASPSAPGPESHPGPETLADLQAGLLQPSRAAAVSGHVQRCSSCAADLALLEAIPARVAAAGSVGPMPADVVARLEEALAAEGRPSTLNVTPLHAGAGRLRRDNRVLQAAAAAVLVLAATAVGVSTLQSGNDRGDSIASGEAAEDTGAGRDAGAVPVLSTGTDYTPESVAAAVPSLLTGEGPPVQLSAPRADTDYSGPEAASGQARLATGPALSGCVSALTDDPDTVPVELPTPLAVDVATFQGQPATVIVLPMAGNAERLDVYVVGPDCSPADAKVLHFARVARP